MQSMTRSKREGNYLSGDIIIDETIRHKSKKKNYCVVRAPSWPLWDQFHDLYFLNLSQFDINLLWQITC